MTALPLALGAGAPIALAVVIGLGRVRGDDPPRTVRGRDGSAAVESPRRMPRPITVAAVAVVGLAGVVVTGPGLTVLALGLVLGWAATRQRRSARAAAAAVEAAMPDAIDLLVMCVHSGYSPTQAVSQLARDAPAAVRPAFAAVEQRLHRGSGFADALAELTASCGHCALALVTSMSAAVRDGLPLAPVLDRLSDEAIESRRRHGEAAARRLPVRLSFPLVACTLPSFVLLAIAPAVLGALSTLRGSTP